MKVDCTKFGSIAIDGNTYAHDGLIRLSGEAKRKRELSGKYCGASHIVSREAAEFVYAEACDAPVLGAGQHGNATLSPAAADFFECQHCRVILPSAQAIRAHDSTRGKARTIGLFRVTC
jgi:hypothetical protein